jgi:hypothetical protein
MSRKTTLAVVSAGLVLAGGISTVGPLRASATGTVTDYTFPLSPGGQIDTRGSLTPASSANVQVKAVNGAAAVPGATIYLSYAGATGSSVTVSPAQCGTAVLTTTPTACTADTSGLVTGSFHAPPTSVPSGGVATITAQDAASSPTIVRTDQYLWGLATQYVWSAMPWAQPGTAATGSGATVFTVTAEKSDNGTVTNTNLYLKLSGMHGTAVAVGAAPSGSVCPSSPTPVALGTSFSQVATATGVVSICYTAPPTPAPGIDTITAQDDGTFPSFNTADHYNVNNQVVKSLVWSPNPIASAGSLSSGQTVNPTVTAMDQPAVGSPAPIPYVTIYVDQTPVANGGTAVANPWTSSTSVPLTGSVQPFSTDLNGVLSMAYTSGTATSGTDHLLAQEKASSPTVTSGDLYTYAQPTHYAFSAPWTPAAPYMAAQGGSPPATVTLSPEDAGNAGVPNTNVWLSFTPTGPATTVGKADVGSTHLSATPQLFVTDPSGNIAITYTKASGPTVPSGGQDIITAQSAASSPSMTATDAYVYGNPVDYSVAPSPIAAPGSLNANDITTATYTVFQHGTSTPVPGANVYLTFTPSASGGSASVSQCGATSTLSASPAACTADVNGQLAVTYSAPAALPTAGTDTVTAADAPSNPFVTLSDSYTFVGGYTFSTTPRAPTGTLTSNQVVPRTLTVTDGSSALPGAHVWLSFAPASGSTGTMTAGGTPLTSTPAEFIADNAGHVALSYKRSAATPPGGSDVLTAQNAATSPSISAMDGYTYLGQFALSPAGPKMAPDGSLGANVLRVITVTAEDGAATPAPGAKFAVKFVPAPGGGHASVGALTLTSTPQQVTADGNGNVTINYTTPSTTPSSGTDTITLLNDTSNSPTITVTDTYSFHASTSPPPPPAHGYYLVASDGGLFPFGSAQQHSYGSTGGQHLNAPIVGMAVTADRNGYYLVASDGGLFPFGSALQHSYGSMGGQHLNQPIVGMALTPDGNGYYLVASDGGLFPFGSALQHSYGSTGGQHLNQPIVGMAVMPDGNGYYLVASDGGLFPFGSALQHSYGSMGGQHLNQPIVGMAISADGNGYYLVASDGGLFPFGSAVQHSYGSTGGQHLNQPIVGMALAADGNGYYLVASDGGLFPFGSAVNASYGSMGGQHLNQPIVGMAAV